MPNSSARKLKLVWVRRVLVTFGHIIVLSPPPISSAAGPCTFRIRTPVLYVFDHDTKNSPESNQTDSYSPRVSSLLTHLFFFHLTSSHACLFDTLHFNCTHVQSGYLDDIFRAKLRYNRVQLFLGRGQILDSRRCACPC